MSYDRHKNIVRKLFACRFWISPPTVLIRPLKTRNFVISAGVFQSPITLCHFFLKILQKFSQVWKTMEIVKIQKKLVIRPLKNSYSKKTIYCFPRKLNGVKLLQQARSTFCLVYALQASQKSHGVAKKRRKTEKTEKKKKGGTPGFELGAYVHCTCQLQTAACHFWTVKSFLILSHTQWNVRRSYLQGFSLYYFATIPEVFTVSSIFRIEKTEKNRKFAVHFLNSPLIRP